MSRRLLFGVFLALLLVCLLGCENKNSKEISLERIEPARQKPVVDKEKPLRIAVGAMITPKEGFAYYRHFLNYLGEKLGRRVEFVDRENYAEINRLLKIGEIDVAFVCSQPYVDGHREFGLELLLAPQAYGEATYYSYIIVPRDSPVKSLADLRGKTFAFSDPLSNTGKLVPTYLLARMNKTPEAFFGKYFFTHGHDKSIKAVAQGMADGAAVDSLIWEYANSTNPEFTSQTKIIAKSQPYAIPPVVVRKGLDPVLKERIKNVFLHAHEDEQGREILRKMMIDRFVPIDDSAYDSIREMQIWVNKKVKSVK